MKCLNCGFVSPEDARFCQQCGKPLEQACLNCGTLNIAGARYCKNCGLDLTKSQKKEPGSAGENHESHTATPSVPTVNPFIEKGKAATHLTGERRIVTVLFADVVGSTSLAEQLDPEDWTEIMNRAFDLLTPVIYHYEGTIARLMGDALLVFFGAPVAHEDDPIRAASASLDLIETARAYANELRPRYGIDFAIRVGLNTGPVVVGDVGSSLAYEYTAMGDAVNLAARMQAAARPNTVLITENTLSHIAHDFETVDLGMIPVKGKAEPVHVFELTGPTAQAGSQRRGMSLDTPMVGRVNELASLMRLGQAVQVGLGRVGVVIGEPGIGKSRLIAEWKSKTIGGGVKWAGHSLSYGEGRIYSLLIDLLNSLLGFSPGSNGNETLVHLQTITQDLLGESSLAVYPYLAHLLSLPLEGPALDRLRFLDPQALQGQYVAALRQLLRSMALRKPLILVLDDVHWADPSSTEVIGKLISLSREVPLLFCIITRPDHDVPGWKLVALIREQFGVSLTEINLQALSIQDSFRMATNLLGADHLPKSIEELVLSKAEGNPLFVEEVIRMLIDRGFLLHQDGGWIASREIEGVDIPDNLQGLLLARIDRLPADARQTLRVAAVIGREFSLRVLEKVLGRIEESNRDREAENV